MWFYFMMMGFVCFIPIMIFVIGILVYNNPPKNINDLYGYRIKRSKSSQEAWDYAQKRFSLIWIKMSPIILLLSCIPFIFLYGKSEELISLITILITLIQVLLIILSIMPVEKELKSRFNK